MERAYFSYFSFFLLYTTIHTFILFLLLPPRDLAGQQGELACYMRQIHSAVERTDAPLLVVLLFFFFLFSDSGFCCGRPLPWLLLPNGTAAHFLFLFSGSLLTHGGYQRRVR